MRPHEASHEAAVPPCPACGATPRGEADPLPFCSPRCKAQDLHDWLTGANAVSGLWDDDDDDDAY